jgi:hypothetical protein
MSHWLYSVESFPHPELLGKAGYTPEYLQHSGIQITVEGKKWTELPNNWTNVMHRDWMDRKGTRERILIEDVVKAIVASKPGRGLTIIDHEPTASREGQD